jgi:hypothetical protein
MGALAKLEELSLELERERHKAPLRYAWTANLEKRACRHDTPSGRQTFPLRARTTNDG